MRKVKVITTIYGGPTVWGWSAREVKTDNSYGGMSTSKTGAKRAAKSAAARLRSGRFGQPWKGPK